MLGSVFRDKASHFLKWMYPLICSLHSLDEICLDIHKNHKTESNHRTKTLSSEF
jgi:hypothetical protein